MQNTALIIVVVLCVICMAVSGIAGTLIQSRMVDEVNAALPSERRFALLDWEWFKYRRLLNEYRRLYPAGSLVSHLMIWYSLGLAAVVVASAVVMRSIIDPFWFASGGVLLMWLCFRTSRPQS
jgi:hypothetical protein